MTDDAKPKLLMPLILRLLLGVPFVIAGWMKLFHGTWAGKDPAWDIADTIKSYEIIPQALAAEVIPALAYIMPWTELLVGVLLIVGLWTRPAALLTLAQLVLYTLANLSVMVRGMDLHCTCFGSLEWPCTSAVGWCQLWRNGVLLGLCGIVLWLGAGRLALDARKKPGRSLDSEGG